MNEGFEYFKNGLGGKICKRKLSIDLTDIESWEHLMNFVLDNRDDVLPRMKSAHATSSSGERPIIEAILWTCDFASIADELSDGKTYYHMGSMSGEYKKTYLTILAGQ